MIEIDPHDRGLTLGDGVFETILVKHAKAIWLDEHLHRMKHAAMELGIGFDEEKIRAEISNILHQNRFAMSVLRITLTRGTVHPRALTGFGATPNLIITVSEFSSASPSSITLATSSIHRNETAPSCRMKTLSYIDNIAAAREVTARADDALMLNTAGHVACTTIGNLFLLKDNQLITPRADQGILAGITRSKLLPQAREAIVNIEDVLMADAVFRTNSLRLATPVTALDGKKLNTKSIQHIIDFLTS